MQVMLYIADKKAKHFSSSILGGPVLQNTKLLAAHLSFPDPTATTPDLSMCFFVSVTFLRPASRNRSDQF